MGIADIILIVFGLVLFEVVSSVDNAVINADVLSTMTPRGRKWFLVYGIAFAVFVVRGLLPLIIVYLSSPGLGFVGAITATFSGSEATKQIIEASKPILLSGAGLYLVFLFLHWLFVEEKYYAHFIERHIHQKLYFWFYAVASVLLLTIAWSTVRIHPLLTLGAMIGSTAFFITNGFKKNAEEKEKQLLNKGMSDFSKILYLELIDATFSMDGVLGAFAFTVSVPLIFIGNGIGALVVRYFTIKGVDTVKKYRFLKNGAMYSIAVLGTVMLAESFGVEVPTWTSPVATFVVIGVFFWLSKRELTRAIA